MDYKELIERLRDESNCDVLDDIEDAATAIEILLAEREAAVRDLELVADCTSCQFYRGDHSECDNCGDFNRNWKWRGPTLPDQERKEE